MEARKQDHIKLAFSSQAHGIDADNRFNYEPMLGSSQDPANKVFPFLGKHLRVPMWVSSMTGGTAHARQINTNLARACNEFGMGMGLGSCRILLESNEYLPDFDVRSIIGDDLPLFANIGIAQLESMMENKSYRQLDELIDRLKADGIIIHVNPIQEWLQHEGDILHHTPLHTIEEFLSRSTMKVIVKEVGQGMGPESIRKVMGLNIEAFELAAYGGTNFAKVELSRRSPEFETQFEPLSQVGHDIGEMLRVINDILNDPQAVKCRQLIISGGIRSFLDGYYYLAVSKLPAVFGQASGFLRHARDGYEELRIFVEHQVKGLEFAKAYLRPVI